MTNLDSLEGVPLTQETKLKNVTNTLEDSLIITPTPSYDDLLHKIADYSLLNELMGELSGQATEQSVLSDISNLFSMMCLPKEVQIFQANNFLSSTCNSLLPELEAFFLSSKSYASTPNGFFVNLDCVNTPDRDLRRASVAVIEVAHPYNLPDYINLALSCRRILALAISNARHYEAVKTQCKQLVNKQQEFETLVTQLNLAKLQAEQANLSKSMFLSNMSHELRTPLNHVICFTELMMQPNFCSNRTINATCSEYLPYIFESGNHLLNVLSDLLEVSKIEVGSTTVLPTNLPIAQVLSVVRPNLQQSAKKAGVRLEVYTNGVTSIYADEQALHRIIYNLTNNAFKFTPKSGTVILEFTYVADVSSPLLDQTTPSVQGTTGIQVTVEDSGCGIPSDQIDRLLKPFEQLDNSYRKTTQGAGLGLAIVSGLVKLHSGQLTIDSAVGTGTIFKVFFPNISK